MGNHEHRCPHCGEDQRIKHEAVNCPMRPTPPASVEWPTVRTDYDATTGRVSVASVETQHDANLVLYEREQEADSLKRAAAMAGIKAQFANRAASVETPEPTLTRELIHEIERVMHTMSPSLGDLSALCALALRGLECND